MEPSLFDEPLQKAPPDTWREVPQALFLSWSQPMQFTYCAARDRNSAEHAESDEWRQFYLQRAEGYRGV